MKIKKIISELLTFIGLKSIESKVKFTKMGKSIVNGKRRAVKMIFTEISDKRKFLSLLYKLKSGTETLKDLQIQHDLSLSEREELKSLLKESKKLNEQEKPKDYLYKVRCQPLAFKIVKFLTRQKTNN